MNHWDSDVWRNLLKVKDNPPDKHPISSTFLLPQTFDGQPKPRMLSKLSPAKLPPRTNNIPVYIGLAVSDNVFPGLDNACRDCCLLKATFLTYYVFFSLRVILTQHWFSIDSVCYRFSLSILAVTCFGVLFMWNFLSISLTIQLYPNTERWDIIVKERKSCMLMNKG